MFRIAIFMICLAGSIQQGLASDDPVAIGDAYMAEARFQEALESYMRRVNADSRDPAGLIGAARAYSSLGQPLNATRMFERAFTAAPKDRTVVHNLAIHLFKIDVQPRALKLLRDYLSANPKPADEPLLYALQHMIATASPETKKNRAYTDAVVFEEQYRKALEAQVTGFKKWGRGWEEESVVSERLDRVKKLQGDQKAIDDKIEDIERELKQMQRQGEDIASRVQRGAESPRALRRHQDAMSMRQQDRRRYLDDRDRIQRRMNRPPVLDEPEWIAFGTPAPALPDPTQMVAVTNPQSTNPPATTATDPKNPTHPPVQPPINNPEPPTGDNPVAGNQPPTQPPEVKPPPKRTTQYGVAFALSNDTLIASYALVNGAAEIIVQTAQGTTDEAKVVKSDAESGLVVLKISKIRAAPLPLGQQFAGGVVQCVGMPNVDLFRPNATTMTGTCKAPGEKWTVSLDKNPRMSGAPLVSDGKVVGVTLADRESDPAAIPAVPLDRLKKLLIDVPLNQGPFTNDPRAAVLQLIVTHRSE